MSLCDLEFNQFYADPYEISCRSCRHFIRVNEGRWMSALRGFCERGLTGRDGVEFDLYISSSGARECKGFELDKMKADLLEKERVLSKAFDKVRTKNMHILFENFKHKPNYSRIHKLEEDVKADRFKADHMDEMRVINNAYELKLRDYQLLIAKTRDLFTNAVQMLKRPHLFEEDNTTSYLTPDYNEFTQKSPHEVD